MPKFKSPTTTTDANNSDGARRTTTTTTTIGTANKTGEKSSLFRVPGGASAAPMPTAAQMLAVQYEDDGSDEDQQSSDEGDGFYSDDDGVSGMFTTMDGAPPDSSTKLAPMQLLAQKIADDIKHEVERRIVRIDGGVLDQPRYSDRLAEIMEFARTMVRQLGVKNVIELLIHAHTKIVYNRHGRRVLDGYVLRCYGNAPAHVLSEVDFGHHSVVVELDPTSVSGKSLAERNCMKDMLFDAIGGKSEDDGGGSRPTILDEGQLPSIVMPKAIPLSHKTNNDDTPLQQSGSQLMTVFPATSYPSGGSSRKERAADDNNSSVPTLSYNGDVMLLEGYASDVGNIYQILVQSHCTKAVQVAHDRILTLDLNISELYRSMAYDVCMTRSARSCIKIARAAAQAMGVELAKLVPRPSGRDAKDPLSDTLVNACAPLTFIAALPQHDANGNAIAPSFIVHVNTFGDYDLARPASAGEKHSSPWELSQPSLEWRAYAVPNSGIGGCTIVRQVSPTLAPMRPYWFDARGDQCTRAASETREQLRPIPIGVLNHEPLDCTGYPSYGVFDEHGEQRDPTDLAHPVALVGAEQKRSCHVVFRSYQQPYQNSKHYAPLVPVSHEGPLYELWSRGFPQALGQVRRFVSGNTSGVLVKYSGGLSGACLTLDLALQIKSPLDYLRVPPINHIMYLGATHLALRFHAYCESRGRTPNEVLRADVRSTGTLLRDGAGHQAFLDNLAGGAIQCDPHDQVTWLIDTQWLRYCLKTLHFTAIVAV